MTRVLVTGATGFIGSHVARALLAAGDEVAALAAPGRAPGRLADVADRVAWLSADLHDPPAARSAVDSWQPEACAHLAWYAEPGQYLHSPRNVPALTASLSLLEALGAAGCGHVVAAGTCAEYDLGRGWLHEDGPTKPETLYAAAKLSLCLVGQQVARAAGMTFAWARIFYPYGPAEDPRRAVPALIRALLRGETFPATEGRQVRDYVYVGDIADAFTVLLRARADGVYNVASGEPVTMRRVMETAGAILGAADLIRFGALPYREWDPPFVCGDVSRLRALGWAPRRSLTEGLRETVEWWRSRAS